MTEIDGEHEQQQGFGAVAQQQIDDAGADEQREHRLAQDLERRCVARIDDRRAAAR